ncbi:MAG: hypothetical protein AB7F96_15195 [Beijerinckiaceae bacterium]
MRWPALLVIGGLAALVPASLLSGCEPAQPYGYVQIKRGIELARNDIYMLGTMALPELHKNSEIVLKQKAGPSGLVLVRGGSTWQLCSFTIGKDRVVTATLSNVRGAIKCEVRG